ncbi:class C sortase [Leucobacter denitrificans]|uniref:Class C sortase n=2 Tax=Leucobacter denitrificans TaxID=683042 RepID=A0A7G9S842_9MICO|nr:class C sortase [Leucobacter denitrificans]
MPWGTAGVALLAFLGVLVMLYPSTASWFSQYNQSQIVVSLDDTVSEEQPSLLRTAISDAHAYNSALIRGEIDRGAMLDPSSNVPTSHASTPGGFDYDQLLRASADGVMARLRIPAINVDLPIYHGTSETTLLKGVGHLEGTSLPVGGDSQHSVLTAHRGLPEAVLFNELDQLEIGDTFTIEVFGEVLTYRVFETQTVLPDESQSLLPEYGKDHVTLVTCTPLGINSHRYLVTGERILPTPVADIEAAGARPEIPGFPWWTVALGGSILAYVSIIVVAGRTARPTGEESVTL